MRETTEPTGTAPVGPGGPTWRALDLPGTAKGLRDRRRRASYAVNAGAALLAAALTAALLSPLAEEVAAVVGPACFGLGAFALGLGIPLRLRARRMRRVLGSGQWAACASVAVQRGASGAVVVLAGGPEGDELLVLAPHTTQWRYHLISGPLGVLWWCGDPRTGGVLAPVGGEELIWAGPVRTRRARRVLTLPQVRALAHRPAPRAAYLPPTPGTGTARPTTPPKASVAQPVTYAAFAAEAVRQAGLRGPGTGRARPGTGARKPWWRVGTLLRASGLLGVVYPLGYAAGVGIVSAVRPGTLSWFFPALAVVFAVIGTFDLVRALREGVPRARNLARNAAAPCSGPRRYVLLEEHSGAGSVPLLLLFPDDPDGEDDGAPPRALLRLLAPGRHKDPWAGCPAPVGTVELHARPGDPSPAVPRIGGRVYWPADAVEALDVSDPQIVRSLEELFPDRV
ncbi:hypothetical protein [Streptomyces sp. NPDC058330]|uniref:hypothetical protein n=1 Tax=Streptomyces sp. NPDC058330 TaxID=3346449 RepID=UPI0036E033FA